MKPKDSTQTELRKINILKNLKISGSYNISAESKTFSIRVTAGIDIIKGLLNTGATFDAYALDDNNQRINVLNVKNGVVIRLTSANLSTQYH